VKLAAISDLHIGARDRTDGFRHDEAAFLSFLDQLEAAHDRIVVLGDLFQAEHGWWFGDAIGVRQLAAAQHRAAALWQRVQRAPYIYIHGNHDHVARHHAGARTSWRVIADGFALDGLDLSLGSMTTEERTKTGTGMTGASGYGCFRVTGGDEHHVMFDRGHAFFTSRTACMRARATAIMGTHGP